MNKKDDFPIFKNNPDMVYLDTTATSQKPSCVIDAIKEYLEHDYANIHRGHYDISEKSEALYKKSKTITAEFLWARDYKEIIYTYNSNYALNLLASSLRRSHLLKKGDKVLLSVVEHHSNLVPWLILKEEIGIEVDYVAVDEDFWIDFEDFDKKFTSDVKLVSFTAVSNVTGQIFDLARLGKKIKQEREDVLFVIDASQSVPHIPIDVQKLGADFLFFTAHKVMAESGLWVLWGRKELLENMRPAFSWGGAIAKVVKDCFYDAPLPDRFEAGTPHLTGAVSLLRAFEYIQEIWWYEAIAEYEKELINYTLKKFNKISNIQLIGSKKSENRLAVFTFAVDGIHSVDIAEYLAEKNICVRAGQHCAEPFLASLGLTHTCRMSLYIYNTFEDIDRFFEELEKAINLLHSL